MTISDRKMDPGTRLIGKHKRQEHSAEVIAGEDGKTRFRLADGREFKSPSAAGKAVTGIACNGWRFWSLAEAKPVMAAADGGESPTSGHTSPDTARKGKGGPTIPAARKAARTGRTARPAAKPARAAKAKGKKTARKASKRTAKAKKR